MSKRKKKRYKSDEIGKESLKMFTHTMAFMSK